MKVFVVSFLQRCSDLCPKYFWFGRSLSNQADGPNSERIQSCFPDVLLTNKHFMVFLNQILRLPCTCHSVLLPYCFRVKAET